MFQNFITTKHVVGLSRSDSLWFKEVLSLKMLIQQVDSHQDKDKWTALGGNTTTNVPMLECGDKVYTQSSAVIRVAARMGGLLPTDEQELYQCDKLIADADDLRTQGYKAMPMFGAAPEVTAAYISKVLPQHSGNFERMLGDNDWFVGSKPSVADMTIYDVYEVQGLAFVPECLANFPKMAAFIKRCNELPKISAYKSGDVYAGLMKFPAFPK